MRLISRRPLFTLSRMTPLRKLPRDASPRLAHRTAVGNLGTRPVSQKVRTMGTARTNATSASAAAADVKNLNGWNSLTSRPIVSRARLPSRSVRSLLSPPSGR